MGGGGGQGQRTRRARRAGADRRRARSRRRGAREDAPPLSAWGRRARRGWASIHLLDPSRGPRRDDARGARGPALGRADQRERSGTRLQSRVLARARGGAPPPLDAAGPGARPAPALRGDGADRDHGGARRPGQAARARLSVPPSAARGGTALGAGVPLASPASAAGAPRPARAPNAPARPARPALLLPSMSRRTMGRCRTASTRR